MYTDMNYNETHESGK